MILNNINGRVWLSVFLPQETKTGSSNNVEAQVFQNLSPMNHISVANSLYGESHDMPNKSIPGPIVCKSINPKSISNKKLPIFLLSNIQSFGTSHKSDKTTEIEGVLEIDNIEIGMFTETWLTNETNG